MADLPGKMPLMVPNVEQYAAFRANQQKAYAQHQAYAKQLEAKQGMLQKREGDLDIADRMLKILDSRLPKPARQFLAKELAAHVGADPKSSQVKDISAMLTSLDPDSLQVMRSNFAQQLDGAPPGKIQEMIQATLSGKVDMNSLVGQAGFDMTGGAGGESSSQDTLQGSEGQDRLQSQPAQAQETIQGQTSQDVLAGGETQVAKPFSGGPAAIQSFEGQRTVPAGSQQASPMIVGALGLDSTQRYRNNDLIQSGYRVPFDPKDQDKLAEEIITRSSGLSSTISEAAEMTQLFQNRPEVLGPVGQGTRTFQGTIRQVEGLLNLIKPGTQNEVDPSNSYTNGLARRVGETVAKAHGLDAAAVDAARIQSGVLSLAYRMAIANNIPGNRLTNAIIDQNLTMIGQSASPEQFKGVLADTLAKTTREFDETMRRKVGVSGLDIVAKQLTDTDIGLMAKSADILPRDFATTLRDEAVRRKGGEAGRTVTPASPTLQEEEQTLGTLETQKKQREIERSDQTQKIELEREQRQMRMEELAQQREERITQAQERDAQLSREKFEYAKQQDIQQRNQQQSDKIGAAFRAFGNAIAGSVHGVGGGISMPSNPAQDPNAFRINPAPQRTPPRPGGNR
jgi:hypothetical protein